MKPSLPLLALLWTLPSLAAAAEPAEAFRAWARAEAARREGRLAGWGGLRLDPDAAPEFHARVCFTESPHAATYLLDKPGVGRWVLDCSYNGMACPEELPPAAPPFKPAGSARGLSLSDAYHSWSADLTVGLHEGQVVLLRSHDDSHRMDDEGVVVTSQERDWEALSFSTRTEVDGRVRRTQGRALLVVRDRPASEALPPPPNEVTFGRKQWTGPSDAGLRVRAFAAGPRTLRLRLEATDELKVPVAEDAKDPDKALVAGDHFEVWWRAPGVDGPAATRQLGVGLRASGAPVVRWLRPQGSEAPLPQASVVEGALELEVPLTLLGLGVAPFNLPFSVSYSDSDDARAGQQTVVSTSKLKWKDTSSFGRLVAHSGFQRFPPVSDGNAPSCEVRPVSTGSPGGPTP